MIASLVSALPYVAVVVLAIVLAVAIANARTYRRHVRGRERHTQRPVGVEQLPFGRAFQLSGGRRRSHRRTRSRGVPR